VRGTLLLRPLQARRAAARRQRGEEAVEENAAVAVEDDGVKGSADLGCLAAGAMVERIEG